MSGTEETVTVDDRTIQLFTGGEGSPLLYLHGAAVYWWMPVHDLLAAQRRVYLPVHPGFGASQGYEEIESIEDLVFHTVQGIFQVGSMPHDLTMKNMELFAREVMPALRAEFP
jgi:pimeloyl-ACP methyl ester carboxylesterase